MRGIFVPKSLKKKQTKDFTPIFLAASPISMLLSDISVCWGGGGSVSAPSPERPCLQLLWEHCLESFEEAYVK